VHKPEHSVTESSVAVVLRFGQPDSCELKDSGIEMGRSKATQNKKPVGILRSGLSTPRRSQDIVNMSTPCASQANLGRNTRSTFSKVDQNIPVRVTTPSKQSKRELESKQLASAQGKLKKKKQTFVVTSVTTALEERFLWDCDAVQMDAHSPRSSQPLCPDSTSTQFDVEHTVRDIFPAIQLLSELFAGNISNLLYF